MPAVPANQRTGSHRVKVSCPSKPALTRWLAGLCVVAALSSRRPGADASQPRRSRTAGRRCQHRGACRALLEDVRVLGNAQVSSPIILNLVRTKKGEPLDPATVVEDYQRIYGLRKFSNVEAKVEPTATGGVIVVFIVSEQKQIKDVIVPRQREPRRIAVRQRHRRQARRGHRPLPDCAGAAGDRDALQGQELSARARHRRFRERWRSTGELIFNVVEGPNVRVRNITFEGNRSFSDSRLKTRSDTRTRIWIFRAGLYDPNQLEDDVAAIRRYYESKGFFDARVGRKVIFSRTTPRCRSTS